MLQNSQVWLFVTWSADFESRLMPRSGIFYFSNVIINILKGILVPTRLVPSSCASAPRNTREAGISSSYKFYVLIFFLDSENFQNPYLAHWQMPGCILQVTAGAALLGFHQGDGVCHFSFYFTLHITHRILLHSTFVPSKLLASNQPF